MLPVSGNLVQTLNSSKIRMMALNLTVNLMENNSGNLLLCTMIPAATQALAEILAGGISLLSTEQIDFNHPGMNKNLHPRLNLYCYNIRENLYVQHSHSRQVAKQGVESQSSTRWFDVSFLVSAWDFTSLGEQRLLSEALRLLLPYHSIQEEVLPVVLRGHGELSMTVSAVHPTDAAALWSALGVPLRPALYVTLTIPFHPSSHPLTKANEEVLLKANKTVSSKG